MSDILSMLALRDRIKQLIFAPTVDKGLSLVSTISMTAIVIILFAPFLGRELQYELFIIAWVSCILSAAGALVFKRFDQEARDRNSERLKKEIDHDYLLRNPKLKETMITLDNIESIRDEMNIIRQLIEAALKTRIDENDKSSNVPTVGTEKTF